MLLRCKNYTTKFQKCLKPMDKIRYCRSCNQYKSADENAKWIKKFMKNGRFYLICEHCAKNIKPATMVNLK